MSKKSFLAKHRIKTAVLAILLVFLLLLVFVWGNMALKIELPLTYEDEVNKYSEEFGIDRYIVFAVIKTESDFDANAESDAGACGLMQLLPETAEDINTRLKLNIDADNLFDADTNIHLGCRYLKYLIDRFGSVETALAAYNGGEGNVKQWLASYSTNGTDLNKIPFKETETYVKRVMSRYEIYKDLYE